MAEGDDTLAGGLPLEAALHPAGSGRSRWAQQELGELLGPSWAEDPSPRPEPPAGAALWEVERLPSEAEGGIVGLLLGGRDAPADVEEPQSGPPPTLVASSG